MDTPVHRPLAGVSLASAGGVHDITVLHLVVLVRAEARHHQLLTMRRHLTLDSKRMNDYPQHAPANPNPQEEKKKRKTLLS
jgi:hypothetical protein